MSSFNLFLGGMRAGQDAHQYRQNAFNASMMPRDEAAVQPPAAPQDSGGGGTQNLAQVFAGLDTAQRQAVKADLLRKGQIIAALAPRPAEEQVMGIETYGKDWGIDPATRQRAAANPAKALAEFSSSIQQAETLLERSSLDNRQNRGQNIGAGNNGRIRDPRDLGNPETPVTLVAQAADGQSPRPDPNVRAEPRPQIPVNMGGPKTGESSKLLGPIDLTGFGEDNSADRFFKEAARGLGDAGAAPPAVILHKAKLKAKQPRAIFVQRAIESGLSFGAENPDIAVELGLDTIKSNPGRFAGRVLGGSAMSLAGNKGTKTVLGKAGKGKKAQSAAGAAASVSIFSTSQYGAAIRGVEGLIDDLEDAGADVDEISTGTIGKAAIAAAAGGIITYDAATGDIILLNPGVEGNVPGEVVLGNLKRRE